MSLVYLLNSLQSIQTHPSAPIQAPQRDWSPFLVHFTSSRAMEPIWRNAYQSFRRGVSPQDLSAELQRADSSSFEVFQKIIESGKILGNQLGSSTEKKVTERSVVCLTECSLPGLLGHSERFGRYGFVFSKEEMFERCKARPCAYLDTSSFDEIQNGTNEEMKGVTNLFSRYQADLAGRRTFDYTHEREWRAFGDIDLRTVGIFAVLVPSHSDVPRVRAELQDGLDIDPLVFPLETLFEWGA